MCAYTRRGTGSQFPRIGQWSGRRFWDSDGMSVERFWGVRQPTANLRKLAEEAGGGGEAERMEVIHQK